MSAGPPPTLRIERLTARAFAPFGAVLRPDPARGREINQGFATRFHDLAEIDVAAEGGRVCVSIFRATARPFPAPIEMLERHPLGAQAFAPMSRAPWLAVVAESGPDGRPDAARLRAFRAPAGVGLVYARGVWHHPLLARAPRQDFLVIDREGPGDNLEEVWFDAPAALVPRG